MRVAIALVPTLVFLAGCTVSPASPEVFRIGMYREDPRGEEKIVRGVVNGLYEYDPARMSSALEKQHPSLPASMRAELSTRYVVRVGINRGYTPIVNMGWFADYVFLPEGWKSDRSAVSADPTIVNVGDVVEIRFQAHRYYNFLEAVVRKCDSAPVPAEKQEWSIGCKTYPAWGKNGGQLPTQVRRDSGKRAFADFSVRPGAGGRSLGYRRYDVVQCEVDCQTQLGMLPVLPLKPLRRTAS